MKIAVIATDTVGTIRDDQSRHRPPCVAIQGIIVGQIYHFSAHVGAFFFHDIPIRGILSRYDSTDSLTTCATGSTISGGLTTAISSWTWNGQTTQSLTPTG